MPTPAEPLEPLPGRSRQRMGWKWSGNGVCPGAIAGAAPAGSVVLTATIVQNCVIGFVLGLSLLGCASKRPRMTQTAYGMAPSNAGGTSAGPLPHEGEGGESTQTNVLPAPTESSRRATGEPTLLLETSADPNGDKFARVEVDVPVMLGSRGGPVVGYLRRGTRVKLGSSADGELASVVAPFPGVHPRGGFVRSPDSPFQAPVHFSIEKKTSEKTRKALERYRLANQATPIRFGLYRELSATRTSAGFAFVQCGRVRELERRASRTRVLAEFEAGELEGWIDTPKLAERDGLCDWGSPVVLPHGYLPVDPEAPSEILSLAVDKTELYLSPKKGEMSRCERWAFVPSRDGSTGSLVVNDGGIVDSSETQTMRSYGINGHIINLGGLVYKQKDQAVVAGGKVDFFAVVRVTDSAVDVLEWEPHRDTKQSTLLGYQTAAARTWYRSRQTCETAVTKRTKTESMEANPTFAPPPAVK